MSVNDPDIMSGDELAEAVCKLLEPNPPIISAREARGPNFSWVSCHTYTSPGGWWEAEIGTDHGPESEDDLPVRWYPVLELTDLIERAWPVVDALKERGWLLSINEATDGWIVNGSHYDVKDGDWPGSFRTSGFVQVTGDTAPEAICRAAVAALTEKA